MFFFANFLNLVMFFFVFFGIFPHVCVIFTGGTFLATPEIRVWSFCMFTIFAMICMDTLC